MKAWLLCTLFYLCGTVAWGQQKERIVFYNVENLFDTHDEPLKLDDEFTPQGTKHWSYTRYLTKMRQLADGVKAAGGDQLPLIIGLAEIENRKVLDDFVTKTLLAAGNYGIVHREGPDVRGIDVALLFCQDRMQLLQADFYQPFFSEDTTMHTRDVLHATMLYQKDTLHFFVCHFPSMVGGEKQSEWKRGRVAALVREKVDSLFVRNAAVKILIMGDLNGKANTQTQKEVLRTKKLGKVVKSKELYNIGYHLLKKEGVGSYRYQGNWQTIDHIIVSSGFLNAKTGCRVERQLQICAAPFLLEEDKTYFGYKPFPTYRGVRYVGGTSDHLPISVGIQSENPEI